tara:strand:- start:3 stop:332 length:330 start_codon:yes stop_codon:yes gene_type:complete
MSNEKASVSDILGGDICAGDICAYAVRSSGPMDYGMEIGVFTHETVKKLSFKVPCWWCDSHDVYFTSAVNKSNRVIVIKDPWFHFNGKNISRAMSLRDLLYNKNILKAK